MAKDGKKYLANNKVYNIPSEKEESFLSDFPNATPIGDSVSFDVNGKSYTIPSNKVSSFLRDFPDAELKKKDGGKSVSEAPLSLSDTKPSNVELDKEFAKAAVENNRDIPFVKRMIDPDIAKPIKNEDGSVSTHKLAWGSTDDGYVVYPTVQTFVNPMGQAELQEIEDKDQAYNRAKATGNVLRFDSEEEAKSFADGAWKDFYGDFKQPNIKETITDRVNPDTIVEVPEMVQETTGREVETIEDIEKKLESFKKKSNPKKPTTPDIYAELSYDRPWMVDVIKEQGQYEVVEGEYDGRPVYAVKPVDGDVSAGQYIQVGSREDADRVVNTFNEYILSTGGDSEFVQQRVYYATSGELGLNPTLGNTGTYRTLPEDVKKKIQKEQEAYAKLEASGGDYTKVLDEREPLVSEWDKEFNDKWDSYIGQQMGYEAEISEVSPDDVMWKKTKDGKYVYFDSTTGAMLKKQGGKFYSATPEEPTNGQYISASTMNGVVGKLAIKMAQEDEKGEFIPYEIEFEDGSVTTLSISSMLNDVLYRSNPSMFVEFLGTASQMAFDSLVFAGLGGGSNLAVKTASLKWGSSALANGLAKKQIVNRFMNTQASKLLGQSVTGAATTGLTLGSYNAANEYLTQINEGKDFDDVNYKEVATQFKHGLTDGLIIGGTMGATSFASSKITANRYRNNALKGTATPGKDMFVRNALTSGAFVGESYVFASLGSFRERGEFPTFEEFVNSGIQLAAIKVGTKIGMGKSPVSFKKPVLEPVAGFSKENAGKGFFKVTTRQDKQYTKPEFWTKDKSGKDIIDNKALEEYIKNPDVPMDTKRREIFENTGMKLNVDISPADVVPERNTVRVYDKDGVLLAEKEYTTSQEAQKDAMRMAAQTKDIELFDAVSNLTPRERVELQKKHNLTTSEFSKIWAKDPMKRTSDENKVIDDVFKETQDITAKRYRQDGKVLKGGKKEMVRKIERAEKPEDLEGLEVRNDRVTEKMLEDKLNQIKKGGKNAIQERETEKVSTRPETEAGEEVGQKIREQDKEVPKEKVEPKEKPTEKEPKLAKEISEESLEKAVFQKSKEIDKRNEEVLDNELGDRTKEIMDDIEAIEKKPTRIEINDKTYRVKRGGKKDDGLIISSISDRTEAGRPKDVTNKKLRKKIADKFNKETQELIDEAYRERDIIKEDIEKRLEKEKQQELEKFREQKNATYKGKEVRKPNIPEDIEKHNSEFIGDVRKTKDIDKSLDKVRKEKWFRELNEDGREYVETRMRALGEKELGIDSGAKSKLPTEENVVKELIDTHEEMKRQLRELEKQDWKSKKDRTEKLSNALASLKELAKKLPKKQQDKVIPKIEKIVNAKKDQTIGKRLKEAEQQMDELINNSKEKKLFDDVTHLQKKIRKEANKATANKFGVLAQEGLDLSNVYTSKMTVKELMEFKKDLNQVVTETGINTNRVKEFVEKYKEYTKPEQEAKISSQEDIAKELTGGVKIKTDKEFLNRSQQIKSLKKANDRLFNEGKITKEEFNQNNNKLDAQLKDVKKHRKKVQNEVIGVIPKNIFPEKTNVQKNVNERIRGDVNSIKNNPKLLDVLTDSELIQLRDGLKNLSGKKPNPTGELSEVLMKVMGHKDKTTLLEPLAVDVNNSKKANRIYKMGGEGNLIVGMWRYLGNNMPSFRKLFNRSNLYRINQRFTGHIDNAKRIEQATHGITKADVLAKRTEAEFEKDYGRAVDKVRLNGVKVGNQKYDGDVAMTWYKFVSEMRTLEASNMDYVTHHESVYGRDGTHKDYTGTDMTSKGHIYHDVESWATLKEVLKKEGLLKEVEVLRDGKKANEVDVDTKGAYEFVSGLNKYIKEYDIVVRNYIENYMKPALISAAYTQGTGFRAVDGFYFPLVPIRKPGEVKVDRYSQLINEGNNMKNTSDAIEARESPGGYPTRDIHNSLHKRMKEALFSGLVYPEFKRFETASRMVKNVGDVGREFNMGLYETVKDRLEKDWKQQELKTAFDRWYRNTMSNVVNYVLVKTPGARIASETMANATKALGGSGIVIKQNVEELFGNFREYNNAYKSQMDMNMASKYDIWDKRKIPRDQQKSTQKLLIGLGIGKERSKEIAKNSSQFVITASDNVVGTLIYGGNLRARFEKLTGEKLDIKKANNNTDYRLKYADALREAESFAMTKTQEQLNAKNAMAQSQDLGFLRGIFQLDRQSTGGRTFGMLASFSQNEKDHLFGGLEKIYRAKSNKDAAEGLVDVGTVFASNMQYLWIRRALVKYAGVATLNAVVLFKKMFGGDDDHAKERIKQLQEAQVLSETDFVRNAVTVVAGQDMNIYGALGKLFFMGAEKFYKTDGLSDAELKERTETIEKIKEIGWKYGYISAPKEYSSLQSHIKSVAIGQPSLFYDEAATFANAVEELLKETDNSEKAKLSILMAMDVLMLSRGGVASSVGYDKMKDWFEFEYYKFEEPKSGNKTRSKDIGRDKIKQNKLEKNEF
jgi:hypothetical protein